MPVTYTITNDDVSSVSVSSKLRAGVRFDWTSQKVFIPSGVEQVTAQFIIDNCRFVESTFIGSARPRIVVGAGAIQIGVDPDTSAPISTPAIAIFDEEWKIVTEKTSGRFVVKDIYMNLDAATDIPYDNVAGVFIQYLTSVTGAVVTVTSGSGLSPAQSTQLEELHETLQTAGVFSASALSNSPSGGLDAEELRNAIGLDEANLDEKLDSIIEDLDEVKGPGFTNDDSLTELGHTVTKVIRRRS